MLTDTWIHAGYSDRNPRQREIRYPEWDTSEIETRCYLIGSNIPHLQVTFRDGSRSICNFWIDT